MSAPLTLRRLTGVFGVHRLPLDAEFDACWLQAPFAAVTRGPNELTVVSPDRAVVDGAERTEGGWAAFAVEGPLPFHLTGVLARVAAPLASAGVPLFAVSTFDTDVILVKSDRVDDAVAAWRAATIRVG